MVSTIHNNEVLDDFHFLNPATTMYDVGACHDDSGGGMSVRTGCRRYSGHWGPLNHMTALAVLGQSA